MPIKSKSQVWEPGCTVKIGSLALVVESLDPTPGDGKPDAYILASLDGTKTYRYQPFNGLTLVSQVGVEMAVSGLETDALNRGEIASHYPRRRTRGA